MEHNNGHWFPVGVLLAGVLTGGWMSMQSLITGASGGLAIERAPEIIVASAIVLTSGVFAHWWRENH